ncbi:hypothetical protein BC826DRAFT_1107328 [Russula brevipes]|nr:hypothetical protein BC826DRAFT_1107328 [Russula brevipes]
MSESNQTTSAANFAAIFDAAVKEYKALTKQDLHEHHLVAELQTCQNPADVKSVLEKQARDFGKSTKGEKKWMTWLDPTVYILFMLSAPLEGIGLIVSVFVMPPNDDRTPTTSGSQPFSPAKTIFTGIGVLLSAVKDDITSHITLSQLFDHMCLYLQRLERYIKTLLTDDLTTLLGKIMAQLLSILALSSKAVTEWRIKRIAKRLIGRKDVEDALSQLETLTKEESLAVVSKSLELLCESKRNELRRRFQTWLSPPDPSLNHITACKTQHDGTTRWFINGSTYQNWKENRSLLWIRGNPGAGKTVLCSAIIEDIKNKRNAKEASVAYYYFDYKDVSKRDIRGLLASILFQLSDNSDRCWAILQELFTACRGGYEQPSYTALATCFKSMIELPRQLQIFVIVDALDECPSTGIPSSRDEVLDFVEDLIRPKKYSNLSICVTSRPELDIQTVLGPLPSASCVSLQEESGQMEDVGNYLRSFVHNDRVMGRWTEEDRELVIRTLSNRGGGMFRWAVCQLDTLRQCFPSTIHKTLDELPSSLDETYERILHGIPKEKRQHTLRLFQCLIAASRPLRVQELAEIFTVEFSADAAPNFKEGWRPENAEEAVLSACSTLITFVNDSGSKIVEFSHFSVKEFLTSDRLRTSEKGEIRHYHIPLDSAHTILAQVCLAVLLQLGGRVNRKRLKTLPLALYAASSWVDHVKSGSMAPSIRGAVEQLFNPSEPHLAAWTWVHDVDRDVARAIGPLTEYPLRLKGTALYYAALCGFGALAEHLILVRKENVNARTGSRGTPLHAASSKGHLDATRVLLDHGANANATDIRKKVPLCLAYDGGHLEVMRLLLERGADTEVWYDPFGPLLHRASHRGQAEVVQLLLEHKADVRSEGSTNWTALHWASGAGQAEVVQILLEYGAMVDAQSQNKSTPLHRAAENGSLEVARILLGHGADAHIRNKENQTAYQVATSEGHTEVAQLLLNT